MRLLQREARTPEVMERWKQIDLDNRVWLQQLVEARGRLGRTITASTPFTRVVVSDIKGLQVRHGWG
ncbi:hypothetical protein ACFRQM_47565 [Streptomyces sp. NPDC056831]|uniref:hypothetical protein n=1 Tax=Streptomyces sp. NPDC056831 TaxID=3345954 RepID=UPI00369A04ED